MTSLVTLGSITNYHRLGGLNITLLLLTILDVGMAKIKVSADYMCGENPLPSLQMVTSFCIAHGRERDNFSGISFI